MKKTLVMLSGLLLLSSTAMAGGVASRSLSSSIAYENPAAQPFTEMQYEITASQRSMKMLWGGSDVDYDTTSYQLGAKFDSVFIGIKGRKGTYKASGWPTQTAEDNSTISLGWAMENLALAAYQLSDNNVTPSEAYTGLGVDWRIGEKFYLGVVMQNGPSSQTNQRAGLAFKMDKAFRLEVSKETEDDGTGAADAKTDTSTTELEVQWMTFVLGHASSKSTQTGSTDTTMSTTYIAWEPESGGFSASIGSLASDDTSFESGTVVNVGFNF